jgi:hypothetical protein
MNERLAADSQAFEVEAALAQAPARRQIQKIRYTHDAMIDLIIMRPTISQGELAATFGFTQGWVSQVMSTDMFKARLEQRREELVDPTVRMTLNERFEAVTRRSLEILQEKLSKDSAAVPDNLVLRSIELGAKALGVGGNAPPPFNPAGDHLATLATRLLALQGRARNGDVYEALESVQTVESRPVGGSRQEDPVPAHQE